MEHRKLWVENGRTDRKLKNSAKQPWDVVRIVTTKKKDYRNDPDLIFVGVSR